MIHFIQIGGTIDKDYTPTPKSHGYNFDISTPAFDTILNRLQPSMHYTSHVLLKKDSLDMTDDDRRAVATYIAAAPYTRIVITHGTDTMEQTARAIQPDGKVVVLTGAMRPYRFKDTDAEFNLGMAIGVAEVAQPGVYIALDGRIKRM